jgi:hypothetical protein
MRRHQKKQALDVQVHSYAQTVSAITDEIGEPFRRSTRTTTLRLLKELPHVDLRAHSCRHLTLMLVLLFV